MIAANVVHEAWQHGVSRLLFLGSSCIYPKAAPQPMHEEHLLTGPLEPTNEAYAIAKIAGVKLCESYNRQYGTAYLCLMPTNLYGPGDNFDLESSHVLPALIRKMHEAKQRGTPAVEVWGTGAPRREFMHVDDLAGACLHLLNLREDAYRSLSRELPTPLVNVGTGEDLTIAELSAIVRDVVGYSGKIVYDTTKPDGVARKLLDASRIRSFGWAPGIGLREGIEDTYRWYLEHVVAGGAA